MKNCKILIDSNELQQHIMDCINSEEIDKFYNCTMYKDNKECKGAMIHGMIIASMLTSRCEQHYTKEFDYISSVKNAYIKRKIKERKIKRIIICISFLIAIIISLFIAFLICI